MRKFPGSWTGTLAKLGFRRKRRSRGPRCDHYQRRPQLEGLEPRHLLSITVNTLVDAFDATPLGDGIVDIDTSTPGSQVSLRAAIEEANALYALQSQRYVISFDPTLAGVIDLTALGTLSISSDLRIEGPGADRVALVGGDSVRLLRTYGAADLEISGLTLAHGAAEGAHGGAIYHGSTGTLTVDSVVIADNSAELYGGGIYSTQGPVHVTGSTISDNSARPC